MHRTLTYGLALFLNGAFAQTILPDSQATQSVLTEIRQLRHDLQTTAATIQRVQIVMYRLQAEAVLMDRATQRLDRARGRCSQGQMQRKRLAAQIEQAETRMRNAQNPSDQRAAEEMLSDLKASDEMWASQEQECQIEQDRGGNPISGRASEDERLTGSIGQARPAARGVCLAAVSMRAAHSPIINYDTEYRKPDQRVGGARWKTQPTGILAISGKGQH